METDAGVATPDAGVVADGATPDAVVQDPSKGVTGGCNCRQGAAGPGSGPSPGWLLFALLMLVWLREPAIIRRVKRFLLG